MTLQISVGISVEHPARIEALARVTGFFSAAEVAIARELADAAVQQGAVSGYHFVIAEEAGALQGFTCFGPIPATQHSFDLYWIAVDPAAQRRGVGREMLSVSEQEVLRLGGLRLYADTSSRSQYEPTHAFYTRSGFARAAYLEDFYAPGDGRITFLKCL
jgi:D-alanine-D-alanine ligase